MPGAWDMEDAGMFLKFAIDMALKFDIKDIDTKSHEMKFFLLFSFTCQGVFNPLCAFLGGFVAQECIKAIT